MGPLLSMLAGSLLNMGTSAFKMQQENKYKKDLMDYQNQIWEKQQSSAYGLQKKGMLDAGINPAAMFGGSGGWKVSN